MFLQVKLISNMFQSCEKTWESRIVLIWRMDHIQYIKKTQLNIANVERFPFIFMRSKKQGTSFFDPGFNHSEWRVARVCVWQGGNALRIKSGPKQRIAKSKWIMNTHYRCNLLHSIIRERFFLNRPLLSPLSPIVGIVFLLLSRRDGNSLLWSPRSSPMWKWVNVFFSIFRLEMCFTGGTNYEIIRNIDMSSAYAQQNLKIFLFLLKWLEKYVWRSKSGWWRNWTNQISSIVSLSIRWRISGAASVVRIRRKRSEDYPNFSLHFLFFQD